MALTACAYDRPTLAGLDAGDPRDGAVDAGGPPDGGGLCAIDADCVSGLCEASACVGEDLISYAAPTGVDAAPCTRAAPCRTITRAIAAQVAAARAPRRVVVESGTYAESLKLDSGATIVVGALVEGRGRPTLEPTDRDAITITGAALTVRALIVTGGNRGNGDGVHCQNGAITTAEVDLIDVGDDGVDLRDCDGTLVRTLVSGAGGFGVRAVRGTLTVRSSSLQANVGGGIRTQPVDALTVTGTVIARNGRPAVAGVGGSAVGGAELLANLTVRFDGNTVADNQSANANTRAIVCGNNAPVVARNNLLTNATATSSTCPVTHSLVTGTGWPSDLTNVVITTPGYVAAATGDFHITLASPAHGAGAPTSPSDDLDLDGEARPRGALDVGADEID